MDRFCHILRQKRQQTPEVVIILSKSATKSLIECNPVNERIITARLNTKPIKISIIQVYSPTNETDKAMQSEFCEILQTEIEKITQKELTIIMGDFNTKVGHDYSGFERTMGKHGCGINNERKGGISSRLLLNSVPTQGSPLADLSITRSKDNNQIVHIAINGKWRRSLQGMRVRRGVDVESGHYFVTANIKLKL
ncbi:craniofacial development protein 2-like [Mytilus edulis]|uniref:craniofacial development protein 2-like n=1 Tax=Mytilus edulis TaxID=6550 RepID=UPI0039F118E2